MKWAIYNILFALAYPFLLPGFLLRMIRRGGYAARMGDRFALYPPEVLAQFIPDGKPACPHGEGKRKKEKGKSADGLHQPSTSNLQPSTFIWLHAVSVGEVQVAGQLMREWRKVEPDVCFCFSTTSSTGWMMAQKEVKVKGEGEDSGDILIYNPLDFPNFVKSALKTVRPRAIVLTESEIWPNFILTAKRYGIPIFLINARVSDRSAPRYRLARFFFADVLSSFTRIFAQSELDKRHLVAAGAPAERVDVTGSFKFDVAKRNEAKEAELREWIFGKEVKVKGEGGQRNAKILLGGSTWPGEDEVLLRIYKKLLSTVHLHLSPSPQPLLVLAPRHFEKADQVEANIRKHGFSCIRRSRGDTSQASQTSQTSPPVYLCDTTGEMMGLFGICDAAFVGKSLCAHGSQNMIEPCLCGKPTVVGPYTENFRPVMSDLLDANAIVQVQNEAELEATILRWFSEGDGDLGVRASAAVANRCGVVPRCVAEIRRTVEGSWVRVNSKGKEMKNTLALIAVTMCAQAVAYVNQGVYIRTTPSIDELRTIEQIKIREEERKQRAEEEQEIDRIGAEMAKLGRSFVGGRPRSVSDANAQYADAIRDQQRTMRAIEEERSRQEFQNQRFAKKMAERRAMSCSRTFGAKCTPATQRAKAVKANGCPKCTRGFVKCSACNATRLLPNKDGRGYSPCTNCTDGYVKCHHCDGKGVLPESGAVDAETSGK